MVLKYTNKYGALSTRGVQYILRVGQYLGNGEWQVPQNFTVLQSTLLHSVHKVPAFLTTSVMHCDALLQVWSEALILRFCKVLNSFKFAPCQPIIQNWK